MPVEAGRSTDLISQGRRLLAAQDSVLETIAEPHNGDSPDDASGQRYVVQRYSGRVFQVRDGDDLIAVTEYRKGADEVRRQLIRRDSQIAELKTLLSAIIGALSNQ